ncbi:MAG: ATP-dependent Clp protease adaptor protein ClpS [Thermoleophilia bacterium]|nr:ATP-dependent Clp protease adaptor protein ClpS [Thermoleophilia bacterium]
MTPPGTDVVERERTTGPGSSLGGGARIVVLNDDHNTFEGVSGALARVLPGVDRAQGLRFAELIHRTGRAIVWEGDLEVAELYWEQLAACGLTLAPLERG